MRERLFSLMSQPLAWITLLGVAALAFLALTPNSSDADSAPTPKPLTTNERMQQEMAIMREWARKSRGDFDKVPAEVQGYMNQISRGHGREWLRSEAEKQLGKKITPANPTKK